VVLKERPNCTRPSESETGSAKLVSRRVISEEVLAGTDVSQEVGEEGEYTYLTPHCHHQNDSCIKTGSDESHFNVSFIVRGKVMRIVSTNHNSSTDRRDEAESNRGPSVYQPVTLTAGTNRLAACLKARFMLDVLLNVLAAR